MAPTIPTPPVKLPATFLPAYDGKANLSNETLHKIATQCRLDALEMIYTAESGHPGSSFSCLDILTYLYCSHLRHDAHQPTWSDRDRFVLSKGHAAPALYAILMETGYIDKALKPTLRQVHSKLQGHPRQPIHFRRGCFHGLARARLIVCRWDGVGLAVG